MAVRGEQQQCRAGSYFTPRPAQGAARALPGLELSSSSPVEGGGGRQLFQLPPRLRQGFARASGIAVLSSPRLLKNLQPPLWARAKCSGAVWERPSRNYGDAAMRRRQPAGALHAALGGGGLGLQAAPARRERQPNSRCGWVLPEPTRGSRTGAQSCKSWAPAGLRLRLRPAV